VRLAGKLTLADGASLTWSVADGARGRRWRAVATADGSISEALLLEVDGTGRPARLELTTPAGMLTLHPSLDQREIHGNVVATTGEGVRPLAFGWGPEFEFELEVVGRPLATAVALSRRRSTMAPGASVEVDVLLIGPSLEVVVGRRRLQRLSESRWRVVPAGGAGAQGTEIEIEIDEYGLPIGGVRWALEGD
jgi:hypothetical protein